MPKSILKLTVGLLISSVAMGTYLWCAESRAARMFAFLTGSWSGIESSSRLVFLPNHRLIVTGPAISGVRTKQLKWSCDLFGNLAIEQYSVDSVATSYIQVEWADKAPDQIKLSRKIWPGISCLNYRRN